MRQPNVFVYLITIGIISLAVSFSALAKEVRYKEQILELREGDRILISAPRVSVRFLAAAAGKPAVFRARKSISDKVPPATMSQFETFSFSWQREDSTLKLTAKGPESRSDWNSLYNSETLPELILEFEIPSLAIEVVAHEGQVSVQGWKSSVAVSIIKGNIKTTQTEGSLRLQLQKGDIKIESHTGRVEIDSQTAKVLAKGIEGDVVLHSFAGDSNLQSLKGNLQLKSTSGASQISKSAGSFDFENGRGVLTVAEFEGSVRGQSEDGGVNIQVLGEPEIHLEVNQATVQVKVPASSGAMVRLQSEEGTVSGPETLRTTKTEKLKVLAGKLTGEGKGTVVVKATAGNIRLR